MKNQVKVKKEKAHRTTYGEVAVVEGKLVLIDVSSSKEERLISQLVIRQDGVFLPIVISEKESIAKYEEFYASDRKEIYKNYWNEVGPDRQTDLKEEFPFYYKILAFPENFSPKHMQAIVEGKMKSGDSVLVEVEREVQDFENNPMYTGNFVVYTNQQGHVVIHKDVDQDNLSRHFVLLAIKAVQRKLDPEDAAGHIYWGQFEDFIRQIPAGTNKEE